MAHRPLKQNELQKIAQDLFDEPKQDDETYFLSNNSEFSEEETEQQTQESDTEQENISGESEEEEEIMEKIFIGAVMMYKRFNFIIHCLRFNDKNTRN